MTFISCVPSFLESVLHDAPEAASLDHLALGGEAFTGEFRSEISRASSRSRGSPISTARPRPRSTRCRIASPATKAARSFRSAIRWRIIGPTFWMAGWSLFRPALSAELYIAGLGWRAGYLRRAAITAERFVADPHGGAGQPDVSDRRRGAMAVGGRWPLGVPGARRRAGEAPRLPHRAWRDRGSALRDAGVAQAAVIARHGDGRAGGKRLIGYVVAAEGGCRPRSGGVAGGAGAAASGLHGAVGDDGAGASAAHPERQARPPRAA